MPEPLSDDLRCRILGAYARREGSQLELARRFGVSFEYVRKIGKQWRRSGRMERVRQQRHGPASVIAAVEKEKLRGWVEEQPDQTLAELSGRFHGSGVSVGRSRVCQILEQMGLRRKKNRSMR